MDHLIHFQYTKTTLSKINRKITASHTTHAQYKLGSHGLLLFLWQSSS